MGQKLNCIEPCFDEAKQIIGQLQDYLSQEPNCRLLHTFTCLAGNDRALGLFAYYVWRQRSHQRTQFGI